jgi:hypothetical protein
MLIKCNIVSVYEQLWSYFNFNLDRKIVTTTFRKSTDAFLSLCQIIAEDLHKHEKQVAKIEFSLFRHTFTTVLIINIDHYDQIWCHAQFS